jgi:hypothetical protein
MKYLLVLLLFPLTVLGQEIQCVEVPKYHKLAIIPIFVPADELMWKWQGGKAPKEDEPEEVDCDGLSFSPVGCEGHSPPLVVRNEG